MKPFLTGALPPYLSLSSSDPNPFQSAARRGGVLHPPHHRGQLHCAPSTSGGPSGGGSLCPHGRHSCRSQTGAGWCGSCCFGGSVWRVSAGSRGHWLRVRCPAAGRGPPAPSPGHVPELSGKRELPQHSGNSPSTPSHSHTHTLLFIPPSLSLSLSLPPSSYIFTCHKSD